MRLATAIPAITARSGPHAWLQEGFATFYNKLFVREAFGDDAYQWRRRYEHDQALKASLTDRLPIVHTAAGGVRIYSKAACASAVLSIFPKRAPTDVDLFLTFILL